MNIAKQKKYRIVAFYKAIQKTVLSRYEENLLYSILSGLIPPIHDCNLHKYNDAILNVAKPPKIQETDLANRPHAWAEINKLEQQWFADTYELLMSSMEDIHRLLKLPSIEETRESIRTGELPKKQKKFEFTDEMSLKYDRIWQDFQESYIGDRELDIYSISNAYGAGDDPMFSYYTFQGFSAGLSRSDADIKKKLMAQLRAMGLKGDQLKKAFDDIWAKKVQPEFHNEFYQRSLDAGQTRVKWKIAQENITKAKRILREMLGEGKGTMDVARYLHKQISEGDLWYWLRLVRSELALAINESFDAQAQQMGVLYEEWQAQSNCCMICSAFDGGVWQQGSGPRPVSETHPNCYCIRIPHFKVPSGKSILQPYKRNPYDNPYKKDKEKGIDEIRDLRETIRKNPISPPRSVDVSRSNERELRRLGIS